MTKLDARVEDRMIELLADRALGTLSAEDAAELQQILLEHPHLDSDVLDVAAAALDLAWAKRPFEPMPSALADKVQLQIVAEMERTAVDPPAAAVQRAIAQQRPAKGPAEARAPSPAPAPVVKVVTKPARYAWVGWLAAAACFLFAVGVWRVTHRPTTPLANERARLMAAPETVQAVFAATKDPAASQATGDVVWNASEQRGYMRFRGLATNDRGRWQYQLWIFDQEQDERFPVDGGVFDVDPAQGTGSSPATADVLVPISAKIKVSKATAFVITVEKPGGVVVSKRERVVMAAKI